MMLITSDDLSYPFSNNNAHVNMKDFCSATFSEGFSGVCTMFTEDLLSCPTCIHMGVESSGETV